MSPLFFSYYCGGWVLIAVMADWQLSKSRFQSYCAAWKVRMPFLKILLIIPSFNSFKFV